MAKRGYTLKMNHLLQHGGIYKAQRDGFTMSDVHKVLYREAGDATNQEREKIMNNFSTRYKGEK